MSLEVTGNEFYLIELPSGKTIHDTEEEAVNHLKDNANDIDPNAENISLLRINFDDEDWTIAEMSWQNIALRLMGGDE